MSLKCHFNVIALVSDEIRLIRTDNYGVCSSLLLSSVFRGHLLWNIVGSWIRLDWNLNISYSQPNISCLSDENKIHYPANKDYANKYAN